MLATILLALFAVNIWNEMKVKKEKNIALLFAISLIKTYPDSQVETDGQIQE